MGFIPEEKIAELQATADIVEVVSDYIPLKRAGESYKALCPFHHEKTPSFVVSPKKQIYHCFGCGVGGNVFKFLMAMEKIDFPEAVRALGRRYGIELGETRAERTERDSQKEALYRTNELATAFYERLLFERPEGATAREYLERRSIGREAARKFRLGFSPTGWDGLIRHAEQHGVGTDLLEKTGLALKGKTGGYYDRFRGRLIFPIFDPLGRIIAFGARSLDGSEPKYLNSPEGPLFSKGRNLYGINFFRREARQNVIGVVEGYTDVIMAHQNGFNWFVASLGTAFTKEHARLMRRYSAERVIILFDADTAGQKASLRSLGFLLEEDLDVEVVTLPEGYDPCDYIAEKGIGPFEACIQEARDIVGYKLSLARECPEWGSPSERAGTVDELLEIVGRTSNPIKRDLYIKQISESVDVAESILRERMRGLRRRETVRRAPMDERVRAWPKMPRFELPLVEIMLRDPDTLPGIREKVSVDRFSDAELRHIAEEAYRLLDELGRPPESSEIMAHLRREGSLRVASAILAGDAGKKIWDPDELIRRMNRQYAKVRKKELQALIAKAQQEGDGESEKELLKEFSRLSDSILWR
jgi:DNA primase